jgi:hypothetical protein
MGNDLNALPQNTRQIRHAFLKAGLFGINLMKEGNQYVLITGKGVAIATHIKRLDTLTLGDWIGEGRKAMSCESKVSLADKEGRIQW